MMFKTEEDIETFAKLDNQLDRLTAEIATLSKKSPDGALNKFKLNLINTLLGQANYFLDPDHLPLDDFKEFDEVSMPTNSDVLIILRLYQTGLSRFEDACRAWDPIEEVSCWLVAGKKVPR